MLKNMQLLFQIKWENQSKMLKGKLSNQQNIACIILKTLKDF